ncbi:hypothetical protein B5X24_HaOG204320 [Helicoverpa armigera]|uniref:Kinesin motor domain-containing protein n=1 Tax=Helicoverpa armigera TaxID=29058 RepID=A0A2W1BNQ6_HELAM|nr:hypothetical protein B5X24_HaOG204320 [Helicoverpa armigera]
MVEGDNKGTIDTVQVALRIRPLMQLETDRGCEECIDVVNGQPQVQIKDLAFTYNYVFPQHITQQEFYDTAVKGLIGRLFQGYNVTILAYGQTETDTNVRPDKTRSHILVLKENLTSDNSLVSQKTEKTGDMQAL